jgi:Cu/Ag efflux protein CusF
VHSRHKLDARTLFLLVLLFAPVSLLIGAAGCSSPKPAAVQPEQGPKRYPLTGRVVSVDKAKLQVTVDAADIPGFMSAMTMGYDVKSATALDPLSPEDQIKADVVVNGNDVHLENIAVTKKADPAKTPAASDAHPPAPKPDKQ